MSEPKKLYMGDRDIPYQSTKLTAIQTRSDIDSILAKWGITKTAWEYDPDNNHVVLHFQLPFEKFGDSTLSPMIRLEPPRIWNKKTRNKAESINWRVSLRILYQFIKDSLAMAYSMQSSKAVAFLGFIETGNNEVLKDLILPKFDNSLIALEENKPNKIKKVNF